MKVYISTMHAVHNYGAALQAFSLQKTLNKMNLSTCFIETKRPSFPKLAPPKKCICWPFYLFNFLKLYKSDKRFNDFKKEFMTTTDIYKNYASLERNFPDADIYLSGSDQVWNPLSSNPEYFFAYLPDDAKRITYAASLGVDYIPEEKIEFFQRHINRFKNISVRENNVKEILKTVTDKQVDVNIDPVFLQTAEEWEALASDKLVFKKPYILVYVLYRPSWLNSELKQLHKETGMDIVLVSDSAFRYIYRTKAVYSAGPREFLRLFSNATAVITSSFHGTAFSLIFKKPFCSIVNPKAPARISSLLHLFEMESAMVHSQTEFGLRFKKYPQHFEKVWERERKRSLEYLENAIK